MRVPCCVLVGFLVVLQSVNGWVFGSGSVSGDHIANVADSHLHSTLWSVASSHGPGTGTNKCNIFVADILHEAGAEVPHRYWWWSPIGAGEWGNPQSTYLTGDACWSRVFSAQRGDVIGDGVHVGIVTGSGVTTSANSEEVVKKTWGFDSDSSKFVLWRYQC